LPELVAVDIELFVQGLGAIRELRGRIRQPPLPDRVPQGYDVETVIGLLQDFRKVLESLKLERSPQALDEIMIAMAAGDMPGPIRAHLDYFIRCFWEEVKSVQFLGVEKDRAHLYLAHDPLFGADVAQNFPSSALDIAEAGKCLALNRPTACVFHLMRVMEIGLRAIGAALGIPYAPSWESYITQINNKVKEKHKEKTVDWKRDESFFKDAAARLETVKLAWRNPVVHVRASAYTDREAQEIYDSVKMYMRHLATRLRE
jgi:hypothetical protein